MTSKVEQFPNQPVPILEYSKHHYIYQIFAVHFRTLEGFQIPAFRSSEIHKTVDSIWKRKACFDASLVDNKVNKSFCPVMSWRAENKSWGPIAEGSQKSDLDV